MDQLALPMISDSPLPSKPFPYLIDQTKAATRKSSNGQASMKCEEKGEKTRYSFSFLGVHREMLTDCCLNYAQPTRFLARHHAYDLISCFGNHE